MSRAAFLPRRAVPGSSRDGAVHAGTAAGVVVGAVSRLRAGFAEPGNVLVLAAALATAVLAPLQILDVAGLRPAWDALQAAIPAGLLAVALAIDARRNAGVLDYRRLAPAPALAGLGMAELDAAGVIGREPLILATNILFTAATAIAFTVILPALFRRLNRAARLSVGLDGLVMLLAGTTFLVTVWQSGLGDATPLDLVGPALVTAVMASAGMAAVAALAQRAEPRVGGVWCGIAGVSILGLTWIVWLDRALHGGVRAPADVLTCSIGLVVVTYGWRTWTDRTAYGARYDRIAGALADWLPNAAILGCVALLAVPRQHAGPLDPAAVGTASIVLVAIARHRLLLIQERKTSRRLAREVEERAATMWSLARLEPGDTVHATAERICTEALRLAGIEAVTVYAFGPSGSAVVLAQLGAAAPAHGAGDEADSAVLGPFRGADATFTTTGVLSAAHTRYLRANASLGTWLDSPSGVSTGAGPLVRIAFAPMRWDEQLIGVIAMGAASRAEADALADRLPTVAEFGVVSSAMLGPALAEHWRQADLRAELEGVIVSRAFVPVFQPILELESRHIVGYEALTRFRDGTRPDKRFEDAASVGLSVRLETAVLRAQLEAASWLPADAWLSVNVSPALVAAVVPLAAALEHADRDVIVELTEHVEILDYNELGEALEPIRRHARLAVDDAGAGYAGLRHILELRPHFVKLDISLVRSIDSDAARQAMVAGMAHFARNAGCELIAEGIETPAELDALVRLGIPYGQGYLLGKPAPLA